jgi:hypothetical protein
MLREDPGILCSLHNVPLYEDTRDGTPMGRYLCPEPGCTSILAADWLASVKDQAWCEANGMTAPGWTTLTVGQDWPPAVSEPCGVTGRRGLDLRETVKMATLVIILMTLAAAIAGVIVGRYAVLWYISKGKRSL